MGSGLDFTILLAIEGFFLSAMMGGFGKRFFKTLSSCSFGQRSKIVFLTSSVASLKVVTNVREGSSPSHLELFPFEARVVCNSSKEIRSKSLLVAIGLYPLLLSTDLCFGFIRR